MSVQWLVRWARGLVKRRPREREMDEEMRFHVEREADQLRAAGHTESEAWRLARIRFGGVERYKEEARGGASGRVLADAWHDVRYGWRGLRRQPAFAAAAILTLAVGIGATSAVWSVVDAVLLRSLPYPSPERLVRIQTSWNEEPNGALSPAEYVDYTEGASGTFAALGAYARGSTTVTTATGAERVQVAFVSAGLFPTLGLAPVVGGAYSPAQELGGDRVVLLAEGYWRDRFGGDTGVVGGTILLSGRPYTVLGVMPGDFRLPENMIDGSRPQLYLPLGIDPDTTYERGSHFLQAAGRLADGVTVERAAAAIEDVVDRFSAEFPDDYEPEMGFRATAVPLRDAVVRDARPALLVALGAVVLVLLVAAANVAALQLARDEARRPELALRATLGARRGRIARQLVVESLLLGVIGGAVGVLLALGAVEVLVALEPAGIPRVEDVAVDVRVLLFAAALSLLTGLLFGLAPAFRGARGDAADELRGARTVIGGRQTLRRVLVVGEIAFALALLSGAGLLGRSMGHLMAVDTGLALEDVLSTSFNVPTSRYEDFESARDLVERIRQRVGTLPGVEAVGAVTNLPLAEPIGDVGVMIPGRELPGDGNLNVDWQAVSPGYDRAIGLRLLQGRWIEPSDRADALGAVVINRAFAARFWPDGDAVGATVRLTAETAPGEARIVGVVEDVKHEGPASPDRLQIYIPHRQFRFWYGGEVARNLSLVIRTRPGAHEIPAGVRSAFTELDPEIGLGPFLTLEQAYRDVLARPRMLTALVGTFATVALLLAAIGVYGVTAYTVGRRRREFGIRMALGARARGVAGQVVRESLWLAGVGVAIGLGGALLLSRSLRSLLFGVSPTDPFALVGGAVVLIAAALLAAWLPARRALRVEPSEALRLE